MSFTTFRLPIYLLHGIILLVFFVVAADPQFALLRRKLFCFPHHLLHLYRFISKPLLMIVSLYHNALFFGIRSNVS